MITNITFNEIPAILAEVNSKLDILLAERGKEPEGDKLMNLEEYQEYHESRFGVRPARQTIYDQVVKGKIPHEKHGKYLYFRKSIINQWWNNGRQIPR